MEIPQQLWRKLTATARGRLLAGAIGWSIAGAMASQGAALLASVAFARLLGAEDYGTYGFLQGSVVTAVLLVGQPLALTATRFTASLRASEPERAGRILSLIVGATWIMAAGAVLLGVLGSQVIAERFLGSSSIGIAVVAACIMFAGSVVNSTQQGILAGFNAFRDIAQINVARALVFAAAVIGAVARGLPGALAILAVGGLVPAAYGAALVRRQLRSTGINLARRDAQRELAVVRTFTVPTLAASLVTLPATWIGTVMLVNAPNGLAEMALFNAGNQWRYPVQFLSGLLASPLLSAISQSHADGDRRAVRQVLVFAVLANLTVSLLPALLIGWAAEPILAAHGPSFVAGVGTLRTLLAATVLNAIASSSLLLFAARNQMRVGFWLNLFFGAVFIALATSGLSSTANDLSRAHLLSYAAFTIACGFTMLSLLRQPTRSDLEGRPEQE